MMLGPVRAPLSPPETPVPVLNVSIGRIGVMEKVIAPMKRMAFS